MIWFTCRPTIQDLYHGGSVAFAVRSYQCYGHIIPVLRISGHNTAMIWFSCRYRLQDSYMVTVARPWSRRPLSYQYHGYQVTAPLLSTRNTGFILVEAMVTAAMVTAAKFYGYHIKILIWYGFLVDTGYRIHRWSRWHGNGHGGNGHGDSVAVAVTIALVATEWTALREKKNFIMQHQYQHGHHCHNTKTMP